MENIVTIAAALSLVVLTGFARAQTGPSPVKTGDNLGYQFITYGERGREIFEQNVASAVAGYATVDKGYSIKFVNGRVENYDGNHTLYSGLSQGNPFEYSPEELFQWKPKDFSPGRKEETSYTTKTRQCGVVKRSFPEVEVKASTRTLNMGGQAKEVPVHEITYKGRWAGSCGGGKFEHVVSFSPELNLVVEQKMLNYYPDGFLFQGNGRKLVSVN